MKYFFEKHHLAGQFQGDHLCTAVTKVAPDYDHDHNPAKYLSTIQK